MLVLGLGLISSIRSLLFPLTTCTRTKVESGAGIVENRDEERRRDTKRDEWKNPWWWCRKFDVLVLCRILHMVHYTYLEIEVCKLVGERSQNFGKFCEKVPGTPQKGEIKSIRGTSVHKLLFANVWEPFMEFFMNTEPWFYLLRYHIYVSYHFDFKSHMYFSVSIQTHTYVIQVFL